MGTKSVINVDLANIWEQPEILKSGTHKEKRKRLFIRPKRVYHNGIVKRPGSFSIVSVVSSGDENARNEYIHSRATLMGALGKWSRVSQPLIFVTELVAFFNVEGRSRLSGEKEAKKRGEFFGFSRTAFGIVKTRTNGRRLFVYTDSGNVKMKAAYA